MSLNWNLTQIKNHEKLCWQRDNSVPKAEWTDNKGWKMNPITDVLIWITIAIDMGEITEKNVNEFYWRLRFREMFLNYKTLISTNKQDKVIRRFNPKKSDIRRHIGLKTNVSNKTRAQFLKSMMIIMKEQLDEKLQEEKKALNKLIVQPLPFVQPLPLPFSSIQEEQLIGRMNRKSQSIKKNSHL